MSTTAVIEPTFDRRIDEGWRERTLARDVRIGLGSYPRRLTPRWLYDDRGSEIYTEITRLPEYYLTEAERSLLEREAESIVHAARADTVIELGAGTSDKTRTLLDAFTAVGGLRRFVSLDVSEQTLRDAADQLSVRYPGVQVHGLVGDFVEHLQDLPRDGVPLLTFLGSTIGNLYPAERAAFLSSIASWLPDGGHLLLGLDLVKPLDLIMAAYNDEAGVTAAFTSNLLTVLNRELGADFDSSGFEHVGLWDPNHTRVDLRLRSLRDQSVSIPDVEMQVEFAAGEELQVEISTKFTVEQVERELRAAGLATVQVWTSDGDEVALVLAERA